MSVGASDDAELGALVATGLASSLRAQELVTPLNSVLSFAEALGYVGLSSERALYFAARCVFVHGPDDLPAFNLGFFAYWRGLGGSDDDESVVIVVAPAPSDAPSENGEDDLELDSDVVGSSFSALERLRHADLAELSDEELAEALGMIERFRRQRNLKLTRRVAPGKARRLDLRRSVAAAVRRDGEILGEHHLKRRLHERRLVVLCDISGSMQPYARAMLRLAHVLAQGSSPIEVFAVGTRLTRLTRRLESHDANRALADAATLIPDYSGGTRLGDALAEFNSSFGVRGIARGATVVICSDGIDRGAPELIASEMARLARVAHKILWVNPLAATPGYQPLARGMAAALPFVDRFLAGDTLQALFEVVRAIADEADPVPAARVPSTKAS